MADRFRVVVTGAELVPAAVERLRAIGASTELMAEPVGEESLIGALRQKPTHAILLRGNPPITRAVLDAAPDLRVIAKHGVGVNSVDLDAASARGILVMIAGDGNAPAVAELTIGLLLALVRDLERMRDRIRAGRWDRGGYEGSELSGRTLGLIGLGRIGSRVAALARAFGMRVIAFTRSGAIDEALAEPADTLDALLTQADIVSLHCPLDEETRGMIDARALALMQPGALLINTARGGLIDEAALAQALRRGHLKGAALDTLTDEPPLPGNPLLRALNVLVTPHIGGLTLEAVERTGLAAAENIAAVLTNGAIDPAKVVNRAPNS